MALRGRGGAEPEVGLGVGRSSWLPEREWGVGTTPFPGVGVRMTGSTGGIREWSEGCREKQEMGGQEEGVARRRSKEA